MKLRSRYVALALLAAAVGCGLIPTGHKGGGGGNNQTVVFVTDSFGAGTLANWVVDSGSPQVDAASGHAPPSAVLRNAIIHSIGFGHDSSILGGITMRVSIKRDSGVAFARLVHAHVGPLAAVNVYQNAAVYFVCIGDNTTYTHSQVPFTPDDDWHDYMFEIAVNGNATWWRDGVPVYSGGPFPDHDSLLVRLGAVQVADTGQSVARFDNVLLTNP